MEPGPFRTEVFAKAESAADVARGEEYGPVAEIPPRISTALKASAAPIEEVADQVTKLIETPAGSRPMRTLLGPMVGALQLINDPGRDMPRAIG